MSLPWLSLLMCIPLLGIFVLLTISSGVERVVTNTKQTTLWTTVIIFLYVLYLGLNFEISAVPQFQETYTTLLSGCYYAVGIDGVSYVFILLSAFLIMLVVLSSWESVKKDIKLYMCALLLLECCLIGVFIARDLLLFFIFFELTLIPMFFIVGIWGGERRLYAAFKFFIYTLFGSLFMLVALVYLYKQVGSFHIDAIARYNFTKQEQFWLWLGFFASFAIKVPMWPVHTWLPDTHVEAPTGGSVILAGILLKLGGYGLFRFSLPFFPDAMAFFAPFVFALSVIALVYASFIAFAQKDIKKLVAYSSVAHMGIVTMGLFAPNLQSVQGALFQMVSHGLISGGLFLLVGFIYDRMHTREISAFGGVASQMPYYATAFMILTLGLVGLPGTMGFVGEILVVMGVFAVDPFYAMVAVSGVVWSAMYGLWLYRAVFFGPVTQEKVSQLLDLNRREYLILAPILAGVLFFGLYPQSLLRVTEPVAKQLLLVAQEKRLSQEAAAVAPDKAILYSQTEAM